MFCPEFLLPGFSPLLHMKVKETCVKQVLFRFKIPIHLLQGYYYVCLWVYLFKKESDLVYPQHAFFLAVSFYDNGHLANDDHVSELNLVQKQLYD